ncbi:site-2 protease family protein [Amycolatopsis dendrobii]|uniref:Site-2 protease family protein n=1 Tax=Amycolatopsis dendrobii TaxID=2760662 RepID=A0A7W3VTC3_9PSEU|nr:site-2 protease family protein [Amycolatopsis dendrobii]MBB1152828.1 site-2 protease family protein [Amycolatopsis dendrobii]
MRPSPIFLGILAVAVAGGFLAAYGDSTTLLGSRDPMFIAGVVLLVAGGWMTSLTLHEFGHAFVAFRGGDHEIAHKGYLSLDVRRYADPVLSFVLPLIFLLIGGIPLPGGAVWINRGALRNRATASWTSLAGPLSNLAVGAALCLATMLIPMASGLFYAMSYLALLQMMTFLINILPVPGLDGWGALEPYLSPQARAFGARVRPWAPLVLFALFFLFRPVSDLLWTIAGAIYEPLGGNAIAAAVGQKAFLFWH